MHTALRLLELAAVTLATCVLFAISAVVPEGPAGEPLRRRLPFARIVLGALAIGALVLLTACGGGDPEDQPDSPQQGTQPVPCATHPELCQ